jgi:hypothetical protein
MPLNSSGATKWKKFIKEIGEVWLDERETKPIEFIKAEKYLGFYISYNGSFNTHITYLCNRLRQKTITFKRITKCRIIPTFWQRVFIKERFINTINYAIESWGGLESHRNRLQVRINDTIRDAFGLPPGGSTTAICAELNIPTVNVLYHQQQIAFHYRVQRGPNRLMIEMDEHSDWQSPDDWAMPISSAGDSFELNIPLEIREYGKKDFQIFLRNNSYEGIIKEVYEKGYAEKNHKGCKNYHLLLELEERLPNQLCEEPEENEDYKMSEEQHEIWDNPGWNIDRDEDIKMAIDEQEETKQITEIYKVPKYLKPFYTNKKGYKIQVPPNYTNHILKLRTGTYPLMHLLKYRYNGSVLNDNCYFCKDIKEDLAHIVFDCPAYETIRQRISKLVQEMENGTKH